ncbi:PIN domain protein [candidate division KSB1 bacterium]|nr:PIN domain protein [candidate division KSB1 bacterium]
MYLDNCCFNRPYDDQSSLVIYLETQAKLAIQESIKNKKLLLVWSFILDYENSANPDEIIKEEIMEWKLLSSVMVRKRVELIENAKHFMEFGLGNKDALHLASACEAKADFFITVDKGIIKKQNFFNQIQLMNPIEFINYLEEKHEN